MYFEPWNDSSSQYILVTKDDEFNKTPRLFDFDLEPASTLSETYTPSERLCIMNQLLQSFQGDDKVMYLHALSDPYLNNRAQSFNCMSLTDIADRYLLMYSTEDINSDELDDLRTQLVQCLSSPVIYQHSVGLGITIH